MKLGVSMWSYVNIVRTGEMDLAGFIHEAKRIGAEGVELLDFFYGDIDRDRDAVRKALDETGLPCPIFSVAQNFAKRSAAERESELDKIRFGIDEALRYGAGVVRVFAGDVSPGISFEEAREWIVEGLAEAGKYGAEKGVRLGLENHGSLAGRGEQVAGLIEDARRLSGTDALGANPDTGNFLLVGQASHEAIRHVAKYATMVHFKDFARAEEGETAGCYTALDGTRFAGRAVGEGDVDLGACLAELRNAGYDGWLSVEYEAAEDPRTGVQRSMLNAHKYL